MNRFRKHHLLSPMIIKYRYTKDKTQEMKALEALAISVIGIGLIASRGIAFFSGGAGGCWNPVTVTAVS